MRNIDFNRHFLRYILTKSYVWQPVWMSRAYLFGQITHFGRIAIRFLDNNILLERAICKCTLLNSRISKVFLVKRQKWYQSRAGLFSFKIKKSSQFSHGRCSSQWSHITTTSRRPPHEAWMNTFATPWEDPPPPSNCDQREYIADTKKSNETEA